MYLKILKVINHRISILENYKEFCSFTSDIEQTIEANDWLDFIHVLEKNNIKNEEDCKLLQSILVEMVRDYAKPSVYQLVMNRIYEEVAIKTYGYISEEMLDEIVDSISNGRDWSENGLLCDNPEARVKELTSVGYLMWPIVEVIGKLRKLKLHNRIEF
jgi:hypothetical protein